MKKIMVVDDEKDLLAVVKSYLKRAGYDVAVTTSCEEGLNILNSFNPDLIYLDINVGTEDGREMCKQIKALAEHNHIPIILISANDDSLQTYKEYQADGIMKKPFHPPQLLSLTEFYLSNEESLQTSHSIDEAEHMSELKKDVEENIINKMKGNA